MAKMIPRVQVGANPRGEFKFYENIRDKLSSDFIVFHRLEYAGVLERGGVYTGEVDFLVVQQQLGLLAVEVKGGDRIEFEPATGKWYSWDHTGKKIPINDPFKQAKDSIYALLDKVRDARVFGKKDAKIPFTYGHSVSFPDAQVSCDFYPPECPRELVIDASDLNRLREMVLRIIGWGTGGHKKPGMDGRQFDALMNRVLMPEFKVACSVAMEARQDDETMLRLTEEQYNLLNFLGERKRALIRGYAGTGKTFVAFEKAKRLASADLKVLLLCFNRPLADHLRTLVTGSSGWKGNVTIDNFHGLCGSCAEDAGIPFEAPWDDGDEAVAGFWNEDAPLILLEAIEKTGKRFDAIIVDEGQDFEESWFDALITLLRDPEEGCFYIFYDPLQNIYRDSIQFPFADEPFVLDVNCRNTQRIANVLEEVGGADYQFPARPVEGKSVKCLSYSEPDQQLAMIDALVKELIKEQFKPDQIVILSPFRMENSCLAGRDKVAGIPLTTDPLLVDEGAIRVCTLHRFKGLESDVVIFCDVDDTHRNCDSTHQYISMSRARHLLYILHAESWEPPTGAMKT